MSGARLLPLGLMMLTACAPMPGAPGGAMAGAQSVTLNGEVFAATLAPGQAAVIISKDGAQAARGLSVSVRRSSGAALGADGGRAAKAAAETACQAAGGRFNARAIGRYGQDGLWVFDGACT